MTANNRLAITRPSHRGWPVWPVLLSLVLVACEAPKQSADYRDDFPLVVGTETLSLSIAVPSSEAALAAPKAMDFERFIRVYLDRGEGPMIAETGVDKAIRLRELLIDAGLRSPEIVIRPAGTTVSDGNDAVLTFAANTVKVPECGDWSSGVTYNWSNRRHGNFGCSNQRNLGLMVEDPGDLAKPRTFSSKAAPHANQVIYNYDPTAGEPTGGRGVGAPALRTGPAAAESTEGSAAAEAAASAGGS